MANSMNQEEQRYVRKGFTSDEEELKRLEEFRKAQAEVEKKNEKPMTNRMFKAI